jgi:hypothetical protein
MRIRVDTPYDEARRASYPSVEDQLDMLWHAMDRNELPRAEPFYSSIKAVKDKFKKPAAQGGK